MPGSIGSYTVQNYGRMIGDKIRTDSYIRGLKRAIELRPNAVVLDIGTGTGIFAMMAARFGARHIYAIEPDNAIHVAKQLAVANGYADRIEFIQGLSTDLELPEKADIIISDIRGTLPLFDHHLQTIMDARKRLLAPDGLQLAQRDTLTAALINAPEVYTRTVEPWKENMYSLDVQAARHLTINCWGNDKLKPEQIVMQPQQWATLDYTSLEDVNTSGTIQWTATEADTVHGFTIWFDTTVFEDIRFSGAVGQTDLVYGRIFVPFATPIDLTTGDTLTLSLRANFVGGDYIWLWDTVVTNESAPNTQKVNFRQSTLLGEAFSPDYLRRRADSFVPAVNDDGKIVRFVLQAMEQNLALGEIANKLTQQFPERFQNWRAALDRAADLSAKYSL
ncbi:MAG: class I SAM-dependent methyltransferase [Burkholderiales bacterium]|nr:class I SAM-dependent methyltransferase [Anaerolineae bacterium]